MDNKKKIIIFIGVIFFILIIWYIFFYNSIKSTLIIENPTYIHTKYVKEISPLDLPESDEGHKFTYSFWLYLKNIPENGNWKSKFDNKYYLLYRFGSPNVLFFPKTNILRIEMTFKDSTSDVVKEYLEIDTLKAQQWQNIVIVLENKNLDVYLDGILENSLNLKNIPFIYKRPLLLGHKHANFNGHIAKLEYYNMSLDHNQIKEYYEDNKDYLPTDMLSYSEEYYINNSEL